MICPKCNTEIDDTAKFCSSCGSAIQMQEQQSVTTQQQVPIQPHPPVQNQYQPQSHKSVAMNVDFGEAIKRLFVNYVEFEGRATRSEYWWGYLFYWIVFPAMLIPFIGTLVMIGMAIPMISCGVRRLHDAGYSWVYILLSLIPFAGPIVMIVFYSKPSVLDNQWGPAAPGTVPVVNYQYPNANNGTNNPGCQ